MKTVLPLCAVLLCAPGLLADPAKALPAKPDIRVEAKAESAGTDHGNNSRTSSRRIRIHIENHEHQPVDKLEVHWKIFSRDINSRHEKVAASGKETVRIAADSATEVVSGVAKFTEREGKSKTVGKGKNKRKVAQPDTGTDYAGYSVEITRNGKKIAEAGTLGRR